MVIHCLAILVAVTSVSCQDGKTWTRILADSADNTRILANSADPDHILQNAVSDQGLHGLLKIQTVKG